LDQSVTVLHNMLNDSEGRLTDRVGLGVLTRIVPRDLVDEVLNATGKNEQRKRLLPARVVVYYVLALTLFYGDAYEEVLQKARQWPSVPAIVAQRVDRTQHQRDITGERPVGTAAAAGAVHAGRPADRCARLHGSVVSGEASHGR
jgi:hypothetical protein